ncbi:MAG: hypothetical protein H7210_14735 [Pyrinomonadaceae bacterium]|nr:hypothetical protein [Phycisphaerales bacterium]
MTISRTKRQLLSLSLVAIGAVGASAALSGCVGYTTYPAIQGAGGGKNTNVGDVFDNVAFSYKWMMRNYPPGNSSSPTEEIFVPTDKAGVPQTGPVAISFLPGMRRESCLRVMEIIGSGAVALTPDTSSLPTYRISTLDVLGDSARVTVHRPVGNDSAGNPLYQAVTLRLRGGMSRWHVVSHRVWGVNTVQPPEAVYLPSADAPPPPLPDPNAPDAAPPAPEPNGSPESGSIS